MVIVFSLYLMLSLPFPYLPWVWWAYNNVPCKFCIPKQPVFPSLWCIASLSGRVSGSTLPHVSLVRILRFLAFLCGFLLFLLFNALIGCKYTSGTINLHTCDLFSFPSGWGVSFKAVLLDFSIWVFLVLGRAYFPRSPRALSGIFTIL